MGFFAALIGIIGGLCAIVGILQGAEVIKADTIPINVTWDFWLMVAGVLLLGCIALLQGRGSGKD